MIIFLNLKVLFHVRLKNADLNRNKLFVVLRVLFPRLKEGVVLCVLFSRLKEEVVLCVLFSRLKNGVVL